VPHRANYTRPHGVRYFFGAYDVHQDKLWMHQKARKRWQDVLAFLRAVRRRYPHGRHIYLVLDNLSSHKRRDIRTWCHQQNVELVFTATYASWMNRIECHFAAAKRFVINNSDYPDHTTMTRAMQKYLRWRNKDATNRKTLRPTNAIQVL
jgi:transposase